jgi:hypothetical protein
MPREFDECPGCAGGRATRDVMAPHGGRAGCQDRREARLVCKSRALPHLAGSDAQDLEPSPAAAG